jgi:hypothetical protein
MTSLSISRIVTSTAATTTTPPTIITSKNVVMTKFINNNNILFMSTREAIKVIPHSVKGLVAVAAQNLNKGTTIHEIKGKVFNQPTMHTVCLGPEIHIVPTGGAECISHACYPSANIEITNVKVENNIEPSATVVCSRNIHEGEELAFNYNTTEWEMSSPFTCSCPACLAKGDMNRALVRGFKFLNLSERLQILNACSPYIRSKLYEF